MRRPWRIVSEGDAASRRAARCRRKLCGEGQALSGRQCRWKREPGDSEAVSCHRRQIDCHTGVSTVRKLDALRAALPHDHISERHSGRSNGQTRLRTRSGDRNRQWRIRRITQYRQAAVYRTRGCRRKLNFYRAALAHPDRPGGISADHGEAGASQGRRRNRYRSQSCICYGQALRGGVPHGDAAKANGRHAGREYSRARIGRLRFRRTRVARAAREARNRQDHR